MKDAVLVQVTPKDDSTSLLIEEKTQSFVAVNDQTVFQLNADMTPSPQSYINVYVNGFKLPTKNYNVVASANQVILKQGLLTGTDVTVVNRMWVSPTNYYVTQKTDTFITSIKGTVTYNLNKISYTTNNIIEVFLNGLRLDNDEYSILETTLSIPNMIPNQEIEVVLLKVTQ